MSRARVGLRVALSVLAIAVAICALLALARWRFDSHLREIAAHDLAIDAEGQTPWRWHFRDSDEIVAGRVFDADSFAFRQGDLVATSNGTAFEIGLPLPHAIDLRRFPHLYIVASAESTASLRLVVRPTLIDEAIATQPIQLHSGSNTISLDLSTTPWSASPPTVAAMLRLRVELPVGKTLRVREVSLARADGAQNVDLNDFSLVHDIASTISPKQLRALDARIGPLHTPILSLPSGLRIERARLMLDEIHAAMPAAIIVPAGAAAATFAQARRLRAAPAQADRSRGIELIGALVFALILLVARLRPPREQRQRAILEIFLVMAVPLWLIVGGRFTGKPDETQTILLAATTLYTVSLGWPRDWQWNASARTWCLAGAVVMIAAIFAMAAHRADMPVRLPGTDHAIRYVGWALLQQFLVCTVCTQRWLLVTQDKALAIVLGALGFGLLHTPNANLMLATFLGGLCWCAIYLRERALLPIAVSHAVSALILIALLPPPWLYSAEVSARFFQ